MGISDPHVLADTPRQPMSLQRRAAEHSAKFLFLRVLIPVGFFGGMSCNHVQCTACNF